MKNYPTARLVFGTINLPKYLKFLEENNGKSTEIEEVKELLKTHEENMVLSASIMFLPSNKMVLEQVNTYMQVIVFR